MQLLAVRTARFIAAISTEELNPRGLVIYPSLIDGLVDRYNFDTYPEGDDELDETKGISFENGNWNGILIDAVTIFSDGIIVNTRSSTKDSEAIFNEAMQWASESIGITYSPSMISRKIFVSEFILRSEVALSGLNPALQAFSKKVSDTLTTYTKLKLNYEFNGAIFHYDQWATKTSVAPFKIERLENSDYSENKYYSVAPLPTEEHLKLLEEFEDILSASSA